MDITEIMAEKQAEVLALCEPLAREELIGVILRQARLIEKLKAQIDNMTMTIHAATPDGVMEVGRVKVTIHEGG